MRILIFGASGKTGYELVRQALEQGHHITAFVRNPSNLKIAHINLQVFQGDVTNYKLVTDAVKGHDAVFSTLGAASPFKYDQSVVDGVSNIVKAMEANGIMRFIYMSAINVEESRRNAGLLIRVLGTTLLRTETAGHEAREKIIRQSRLDWTLVRSAKLSDGKFTGKYRSGEDIKAKGIAAGISRADVADFLLRQLTNLSYIRKVPMVMY
ncbi:SDR family oxidoreductase [Flavihumibacter sp. R14]|nr:SDR family oxidoreductase [Flavihumibacter soli]